MEENQSISDQQARAKRLRQLLSQNQKSDIKEAFDYFDQGGVGQIKKKELKVILRALGFNPTNEELDKLVQSENIDFQEFMDIMLTKIEEKLSKEDIKYAFKKIAMINRKVDQEESNEDGKSVSKKKGKKKENIEDLYITCEDIEKIAKDLNEKLTKEEIEEMLIEAIAAGRLLNKEAENIKDAKNNKKKVDNKEKPQVKQDIQETFEDELLKPVSGPRKINLHEFKTILTWENN